MTTIKIEGFKSLLLNLYLVNPKISLHWATHTIFLLSKFLKFGQFAISLPSFIEVYSLQLTQNLSTKNQVFRPHVFPFTPTLRNTLKSCITSMRFIPQKEINETKFLGLEKVYSIEKKETLSTFLGLQSLANKHFTLFALCYYFILCNNHITSCKRMITIKNKRQKNQRFFSRRISRGFSFKEK